VTACRGRFPLLFAQFHFFYEVEQQAKTPTPNDATPQGVLKRPALKPLRLEELGVVELRVVTYPCAIARITDTAFSRSWRDVHSSRE
jgi:hypothetical protein